jgi:hypothetical protein
MGSKDVDALGGAAAVETRATVAGQLRGIATTS